MEIKFIKKAMSIGTHLITYWFEIDGEVRGLAEAPYGMTVTKMNGQAVEGAFVTGGIGWEMLEQVEKLVAEMQADSEAEEETLIDKLSSLDIPSGRLRWRGGVNAPVIRAL